MIDRQTVFEIHRLKNEGLNIQKISEKLQIAWKTVQKYLEDPDPPKNVINRPSKLDPFKEEIERLLAINEDVSAVVIKQRLDEMEFDGGITIVKDYLQTIRKKNPPQAFIRFESKPGEQIQIDWGHFGSLSYDGTNRKLYVLAVIECHSRMLYVEFTHSQKQEALHQCLINAFIFFGGSPGKIVVDNMLTAVTERQGSLIRFNERFLDFLRPFKTVPHACNVRAPQEKGKVENSIKYIRRNFWPLRTFTDLGDVQTQALHWLDTVANKRIHQTTGERPEERLVRDKLIPLPELLPDTKETSNLKVHKDFAVRFDGNIYSVPPWTVGKDVILKADFYRITIYYKDKRIATHSRSWKRKERIEIPGHKEQVKKLHNKLWQDKQVSVFLSLGEDAADYLQSLVQAGLPIKKNVSKLLKLKDEYGASSVAFAIRKAQQYRAYGADYIENILYQEMTPINQHPPVQLKNELLNRIRLNEPSLAEYDAYIIKKETKDD
ncbi:MAG: IS21 family transposase [Desulfobacterales bacterium]|nr:IS21 family transposase [Desulfobacterales bacterium]